MSRAGPRSSARRGDAFVYNTGGAGHIGRAIVDDLVAHGLDDEGVRKVMGGNLIDLFKVPNEIRHSPDVPALVIA